jgi:3-oxoacyl-[acyl-carrier protein] reductase
MSENHTQKVVWMTGAAGGLGRALISEFAALGWRVAATTHRPCVEISNSESIWTFVMPVEDHELILAGAARIVQRWGPIDVLINNAGVTADGLLARTDEIDWDTVLSVNLKGAFLCAQAVLKTMIPRRSGHILNISSHAAKTGASGQSNYAAAKAGLVGLTQSLAREAGKSNIQVNAIFPGVLPTAMTRNLPSKVLDDFARANVLERLNDPVEVSRFIAFVAGMKNISGQVLQLDSRISRWT